MCHHLYCGSSFIRFYRSALLLLALFLAGCQSGKPESGIDSCAADGELRVICNLQAPEDLTLLPDGSGLLVSEYGEMGVQNGRISLLDLATEQSHVLYDAAMGDDLSLRSSSWGDADCEQPLHFSPHGIHLSQRPSGRWQLLVVNHGDREAVEMFELARSADGFWGLQWQGCVEAQGDAVFNDVVATHNGFVVTHFTQEPASNWLMFRQSWLGADISRLWHWTLQEGLAELPNSGGRMLNGIALDPTQRGYLVNDSGASKVLRYSAEQQAFTESVEVEAPDNSSVTGEDDEKLLIASLQFSLWDMLWCNINGHESCGMAFSVVELDPVTLQKRKLFASDASYFGSGTAAVRVGDKLYIGSYTGERMLVAPVGYGVENHAVDN